MRGIILLCSVIVSLLPALATAQPLKTVWLRDLETKAGNAIARGQHNLLDEMPTGLCDLTGLGWDITRHDVFLIGPPGSSKDCITFGLLAESFRFARHDPIAMTLTPKVLTSNRYFGKLDERTQAEFLHRLVTEDVHVPVAFPNALEDSLTLQHLISADAEVKRLAAKALAATRRQEATCSADLSTNSFVLGRVMFLPGEPDLDFRENAGGGLTVWIRRDGVFLRPETDLVIEGSGAAEPDQGLEKFSRLFSARLEAGDVPLVFRRLKSVYKRHLAARLLLAEPVQKDVGWNASFWLEFPVRKHATPRELKGLGTMKVRKTCWGKQYSGYEYSAAGIEHRIWGGVLISYNQSVLGSLTKAGRIGMAIGASLATSTSLDVRANRALVPAGGVMPVMPVVPLTNQIVTLTTGVSKIRFAIPEISARMLLPLTYSSLARTVQAPTYNLSFPNFTTGLSGLNKGWTANSSANSVWTPLSQTLDRFSRMAQLTTSFPTAGQLGIATLSNSMVRLPSMERLLKTLPPSGLGNFGSVLGSPQLPRLPNILAPGGLIPLFPTIPSLPRNPVPAPRPLPPIKPLCSPGRIC